MAMLIQIIVSVVSDWILKADSSFTQFIQQQQVRYILLLPLSILPSTFAIQQTSKIDRQFLHIASTIHVINLGTARANIELNTYTNISVLQGTQ
jgi:hypothetical protein